MEELYVQEWKDFVRRVCTPLPRSMPQQMDSNATVDKALYTSGLIDYTVESGVLVCCRNML